MATTKTGTPIDASGNAIDTAIVTVANGSLADANDIMASLNDIEADLEGHSHSLDSKVGYDSFLASCNPVDGVDSANRWAMVSGEKTFILTSGTATATITFATDSDQGDPSFTTAPRVALTVRDLSQNVNATVVTTPSTTSVLIRATILNGGTTEVSVDVNWMAYGKVA